MAIEIDVATKDCTALTDAELAEMADLSAERAGRLRGGLPLQAARGVGARHPRPRGGQAARLRAQHPRAHRRHAEPAHRGRRLHAGPRAPAGAGRGDARPLPPCGARLPRRGRPRRHADGPTPAASAPSPASRTSSRGPSTRRPARSGPGAGGSPSASASTGNLDDRIFVLQGDGDAAGLLDFDPQEPPASATSLHCLFEPLDGRAATASSPSAGRWPRTSPPHPSPLGAHAPRSRPHPASAQGRGRTPSTSFGA